MEKKYMILKVEEATFGPGALPFRFKPHLVADKIEYYISEEEAEAVISNIPAYSTEVYSIVPVFIKGYKPSKN